MSKTRLFHAALLLAACTLPGAAQAQQGAPQLFGLKDFEIEWKVEPSRALLSARYLAARRQLRMEVLDGTSRAVIRDIVTGEALLVIAQGQRGVFRLKVPPLGRFKPGPPGASHEVGGERCLDFTAGPVTLCLTDDGIPLKMSLGEGSMTASRLIRQPQHPALFEPPKGVEPKPLPAGAKPPALPF